MSETVQGDNGEVISEQTRMHCWTTSVRTKEKSYVTDDLEEGRGRRGRQPPGRTDNATVPEIRAPLPFFNRDCAPRSTPLNSHGYFYIVLGEPNPILRTTPLRGLSWQ
ncbi:hypothetical protein K0M31_008330 [Melipona bicolor]|uniref:Uncharacterized protein n=1 Tax=Melipona bicolor TaxID=60889 RepID=A0AA40FR47_9HYME|nr:hypothetical protein K0M31_008330 [Melipona bicolor]